MSQTKHRETRPVRNYNEHNIQEFKTKLSYEICENVFDNKEGSDINRIFNNFRTVSYTSSTQASR